MPNLTDNIRGALLMIASMACFTFNDALVKVIGQDLPLFQIIAMRGILATALIYALARYLGKLRFDFSRRDWALVGLRSVSEIFTTYFFLTALLVMPIANVTAVLQALPLTVTLGAALVFREAVGWRRLGAILIGFVGVLLIIRPGPEGFSHGGVYVLLAVACITVRDLCSRGMSSSVPSLTVTLLTSTLVTVCAGLASVGTPWQPVDTGQVVILSVAGFLILGGYLFSVLVMRVGDVSFTSPFRYTGLIWALLLGWLIFADWPDNVTLLGALLVVSTGVFTLYRERLRRGA
ncbi:DMT family transporter [Aliisedimentitalea scapharcae]|uniref:DMT family transporter n=1 Tax=Aliisedimentitalea scapharcae TaxID=1524259 RepID=UPI00387389B4